MFRIFKSVIPSLSFNISPKPQSLGLGGLLCARDKSARSFPLRPHKRKYRYRCIRTPDSTFVTAGTTVVYQRGLVFFPGLNVGVGRDFSLFAMEHGRVFVTTEKTNLNWDHSFVQTLFKEFQDTETPIYKTYLHVIPIPMPNKFKLLEQY